jgi:mannosyltransferase
MQLSKPAEDQKTSRNLGESPQASPADRWTPVSVLTLVLLAAVATALRFFFLARKPFWFDECFSVEVARLSWHDFARLMWWREANMSLYYILLRGWLALGSVVGWEWNPFFIRSLSVLASLATLPAIYWLGSKLFDRRAGLIATALATCNAYSIRYAQEARSYSFFLLLATLASGFFVSCLRQPTRENSRNYVLATVLGAYAHLYALLLVAAQWVALRFENVSRPADSGAPSSRDFRRRWILIGVAVFPLLAFAIKTGAGPIRWISRPALRDILHFWEQLAGNGGWPLLLLYVAACLVAILPVRGQLFRPSADFSIWRYQFLLQWLIFPVTLTLLLSLARPLFLGRYFIFCLPPLIILAAAGLASLRKAWMMSVCLAAMLLLSLQGTLSYYDHDFDLNRDGAGGATAYILDHSQPGDAILFHIAEGRIPYEFFRSALENHSMHAALSPEIIFPRHASHLDYRDVTGKPAVELLQSIPARHDRVWLMLMSNGTPDHPDATTLTLKQHLAELFPRQEQVQFPQVEIILYRK